MSFEEYAQHMTKKYKLAIAIAVIQNKPVHLTMENYITELKRKIEYDNEDDQFNINDNDFNFNDDDSLNCFETQEFISQTNDELNLNEIETNLEAVESSRSNAVLNCNVSSGTDDKTATPNYANDYSNTFNVVLRTMKDIDSDQDYPQAINDKPTLEHSKQMPIIKNKTEESTTNIPRNKKIHYINLEKNTQITIDERIRANVAKNINKIIEKRTNDKDEFVNENSIQQDEFTNVLKDTYEMEVEEAINEILCEPVHKGEFAKADFVEEKVGAVPNNNTEELNEYVDFGHNIGEFNTENVTNNNDRQGQQIPVTYAIDNTNVDTQETILYTLQGLTQNYTHVSQSQYQNMEISQKFIHGNRKNDNENNNNNKQNNKDENVDSRYINAIEHIDSQNKDTVTNPNDIEYIIDHTGRTYAVLQSYQLNDSLKPKLTDSQKTLEDNVIENSRNTLKANRDTDEIIDHEDGIFDLNTTDSQVTVPFKVVKELSQIKAFLSRKETRLSTEGFSSDSGYRSDSQSSFKVRQSEEWVHQSAHCIYNYLVECPLVTVTQEIVVEISQVLGKLIDRLHLEEKYPAFLEELLDKVDTLLQKLSQECGEIEHILLEKDETIQRLLLLNKSTHILKFSLDKITKILERAHTQLTSKENLYEISSIGEVENLRYVFYVLEIFIQKYLKVKDSLSQSQITQNSQASQVLKKSSISEIWRRKWNPDMKVKNVDSQEKICVLVKCGDVLNRIIVDCIDVYSLVSFAALQCFNLLQN